MIEGLPENHCLKGVKIPETEEQFMQDVKDFGPVTQVAYKAAVLHAMFKFPVEDAIRRAIGFGLNSDEAFFKRINAYFLSSDMKKG